MDILDVSDTVSTPYSWLDELERDHIRSLDAIVERIDGHLSELERRVMDAVRAVGCE